ncbi:transcription termination factor Rho [Coriobacterium glomerans PW2]|uniref:Transcription termination factor Rho n=1 Tax=Coriobacterium glomerans (strain ATCC 49209 / DSM 20642 / JCM 10262 / PW2) TaxID=700015 RepID=F2N866_CORGP|nr:transcription termination factor Rho [Coriobacterium glomerans]AEB07249.1 transcription termination factor Rho [Coriobacterium glomerans PW2]
MQEENTEHSENVIAADGSVQADAAPPRRRARKPRAKAKSAEGGPAQEDGGQKRSARRGASGDAPAADSEPQEASVSGGDDAPRSRRGARTRRRASRRDEQSEVSRDEGTTQDGGDTGAAELDPQIAQARALAKISQASIVRQQRQAAERAAAMIAAPSDGGTASASAIELAIDPSLRPHRRGRKPKAYLEAERAARLAAQAALGETRASDETAEPSAGVERPSVADHADATDAASPEGVSPTRQSERHGGRARRDHTRNPLAHSEDRSRGGQGDSARREHGSGASQNLAGSSKRQHQSKRTERTRSAERAGGEVRRGNGNRPQQMRKQRSANRYNAPTEPTLTRDQLGSMKVAELRDKATELELDYAGKRKAELIDEIFAAAARAEGFREVEGVLDIANDGFGHIRVNGYMPSHDDAFVSANLIRGARLRAGDFIIGTLRPSRPGDKYPGLAKITSINGVDPEDLRHRPKFSELTPIYPNMRLQMEHGRDSITGRAIDIVAPVGKGQRGLIVSPPKAGKTTILKKICQSIAANNPEVHLICLLVDERPEEVTDMQRSIRGDVVASTFDMPADNHTRVSELVIERAKRIVEMGGDVVVVLDSITRLARAYNLAAPASGRILSGGVDSAALYPPKRFLGAARNIENGGSLTILASALVDTGSKMDEVIFEEFKGTGNMELKLDRDLADRRIFPAINPVSSGTRNEDLLIDETMRPFVWGIRRVLANMNNTERCASAFIKGLKSTATNEEFLVRSAKRAAEHPDAL